MPKSFIAARQTTLRREVELAGKGVHTGAPASVVLHPAESDTGLRFLVSKRGRIIADIPAEVGNNCYIEIDSKEVPIMDGSSCDFVEAIDRVGIRELAEPRKFIKVLKPVRVEEGDCWGQIVPHSGFRLDVEIEFPTPIIGRQRIALEMSPGVFRHELSRARTFGFMSDVEKLWKMGLALGADLTNTVAIGDGKIMNREGLRYEQEFVRHKMLDAVGDLSLAGAPLLGSYSSYKGGHRLNSMVLQALFADASNWAWVQAPRTSKSRAPISVGHRPAIAVAE